MKSLVEFINEAKMSPAKEFFNLWKTLSKGLGTSGANAVKVDDKFKIAFENILKFLEDYKIRSINANESALKNLYFFLNKHGKGTDLYVSNFNKDFESFDSADLFVGDTAWVSTDYTKAGELFKYKSYMIPNVFDSYDDAERFVRLLSQNLTGDIEDEKLLK